MKNSITITVIVKVKIFLEREFVAEYIDSSVQLTDMQLSSSGPVAK